MIALLLSGALAFATDDAFEPITSRLSVALGLATQTYELALTGPNDATYVPNLRTLSTISVNYAGWGGLTYGTRNKIAESDLTKGDSRYDDLRLNLPFHQLAAFVYYSRYQGFYLKNTNDFSEARPSDQPYLLYPHLYAQNYGANFTWVWNPERFSLAAAMDMSERQIQPGGSYLLGASASETFFRNDAEILPASVRAGYERDGNLREGRVRSLSVKGGYGYTYAWRRRYFASGLFQLGLGPQEVTFSATDGSYRKVGGGLNLYELYFGGGFNGDRWFGGLGTYYYATNFAGEKAQLSTRVVSVNLFFGARLDPSTWSWPGARL